MQVCIKNYHHYEEGSGLLSIMILLSLRQLCAKTQALLNGQRVSGENLLAIINGEEIQEKGSKYSFFLE